MKRFLLAIALLLVASSAYAVDVSVTAAEVLPDSGTRTEAGTLGAVVTAGQLVYKDTSDSGKFKLCDSDASAAAATVYGIALNGGAAAQPVVVAINGSTLDPGFTVTVGAVYVVSDTAGGIMPVADLETGDFTSVIGVGITASKIQLTFINSGVAVP
jgi:hypothetical protein